MKNTLFFVILYCLVIGAFAQSKLDIGFQFSPLFTAKADPSINLRKDPSTTFAFGPKLNWTIDRLHLSAGILHIEQIAALGIFSDFMPNGTLDLTFTHLSKKQILLPISMHYILIKNKSFKVSSGGGIYMGVNYQEKTIITNSKTGETTSLTNKSQFYTGVDIGVGLHFQISPKISLEFRPNLLHELKGITQSNLMAGPMLSYGAEFGIYCKVPFKSDIPQSDFK